jgi:toxin CcdB
MEQLTRFDVAEYSGISMVIVESNLLPPDPSVVVIPLVSDYPAVQHLNPELQHDGRRLILATRLITAVRRSSLHRTGSVAGQGDLITRAVDVLMAGV